jgi:release factor glutamine methyltransferase
VSASPSVSASARATGASVANVLREATVRIAAAGCETPRLDAELLVAHALGIPRERLLTERDLDVSERDLAAVAEAVRRRAQEREPVAYITGRRNFRYLELEVDRRVLIPRPETELLVELALTLPRGASVLDVGTGSGAVALALKQERPDLRVAGSDISTAALALASANGRRLALDVQWLHSDLLAGVPDEFHAVLCNPPYVSEAQRRALSQEVARHEPAQALFAGADGLVVIRRLLAQLASRTRGRVVALEVGAGQAPDVRSMMYTAHFSAQRTERDLSGIERVVVGERGTERSRQRAETERMVRLWRLRA